MLEVLGLSGETLVLIAVCAFVTAVLHGATGMAGGLIMAAILSHIIGVKAAIPVITCALLLSHSSRVYLYRHDAQWRVVGWVLLFSVPTIAIGSTIFTLLSPQTIALLMAAFLTLSFPIKYLARRHQMQTSPAVLATASSLWGLLAGNVVGPGFVLAPFLLGTGMNRLAFVGSLATIVLCMNAIKVTVFGVTELMTAPRFLLGLTIGIITIPGNWLGREILKKLTDHDHRRLIDSMTVLIIVNFVYLAWF